MQEKPCEISANCPYARRSIQYKIPKKKRGDKNRQRPDIEKIQYYCLYQKERTEITSDNRHCIACQYDN